VIVAAPVIVAVHVNGNATVDVIASVAYGLIIFVSMATTLSKSSIPSVHVELLKTEHAAVIRRGRTPVAPLVGIRGLAITATVAFPFTCTATIRGPTTSTSTATITFTGCTLWSACRRPGRASRPRLPAGGAAVAAPSPALVRWHRWRAGAEGQQGERPHPVKASETRTTIQNTATTATEPHRTLRARA
jgi:hypothetical protein